MNLEKWKTSVIGVGPWIVSDKNDPLEKVIGVFREEKHADIFLSALQDSQAVEAGVRFIMDTSFGGE